MRNPACTTGRIRCSVSYSQGEGSRSVTYQQTNAAQLQALIRLLQASLGINAGRRPVRFNFQ